MARQTAAQKAAAAEAAAPVTHDSLAAALFAFQGENLVIPKESVNSHFGNKYAGLPVIMDYVRPLLQKHGLATSALLDQASDGSAALRTVLMHPASNQEISGVCAFPSGINAQQMGSAVTYFRRYGLLSILGIVADDDDDGNAAVKRETRTTVTVPSANVEGGTITTPLPAADGGIGGPVGY